MRIYCKLMSNQCCLTPAAPAPSFPLQTRREIREGEITIITDNLSDFPVFTDLAKLDDDKTWQDMLDYIGEPGSHKQRPYFITKENRRVVISDPRAAIFTPDPGFYVIVCYQTTATGLGTYPGSPLEVR